MSCRIAFFCVCLLSIGAALSAAPTTEPASKGTVTGVAVDAAGKAIGDCVVTATESGQRLRHAVEATTDKDGKFTLDLPEGRWNIVVTTKDTKLKATKSVEILASRTVELGKIVLKPRRSS